MKKSLLILAFLAAIITSLGAKEVKRPDSYNYSRGVEAVHNEDAKTAIEYFGKELEENPKNGYAFGWIAFVRLYYDKQYGQALTAANYAIKYIPKNDPEYYGWAFQMRAKIYINLEDTAAALKDYTQAIKIQPEKESYYEDRAEIYFRQQKYDLADQDYKKLIQLSPGGVMGYMGLGRNLKEQGKYDEAIGFFNKVIKMHDDYASGFSFRAECYLKQNKYDAAIDDIIKALYIGNDDKAFGMMLDIQNEEDINTLKAKLRIQGTKEPNEAIWDYYIGAVNENADDFRTAIDNYKTAKTKNPFGYLDERISECYYSLGDFDRSLEYINYAISMDSTDTELFRDRADIYAGMGNRAKAIEDMDIYVNAYPDYYYAYYRRGRFKHLEGQLQKAIDDFSTAIVLNPNYDNSYDGRGRSYLALGKTDLAKKDFEKVIAMDTIPGERWCAVYAYYFLGKTTEAENLLREEIQKDTTEFYTPACFYALIENVDNALFYLQKAYDNGFRRLQYITIDTDFDKIRNNPKFQELMRQFEEQHAEEITMDEEISTGEEVVVDIPFTSSNGVTKVNCTINDLPLNFVFDTGAADVTISMVEATFMMKNGYLDPKDIVGKQYYQTADGNISEGTVINLRSINFGGLSLTNIRASVVKSQNAPLLLGQTILQRLGKIEIDNEHRLLRITTRK